MTEVILDIETYSKSDLRGEGVVKYFAHLSTGWHCLSYTTSLGSPFVTIQNRGKGSVGYGELLYFAKKPEVIFVAHNALFEMEFWQKVMVEQYDYPPVPVERWKCTMAKSYAHGLPGSLEEAAKALQLPIQKDMSSRRIMLKLAKPKKDGTFWTYDECPEDFETLYRYCQTDVETEYLLNQALRDLSKSETRLWQIDYRMNREGFRIDKEFVEKAITLSKAHEKHMTTLFKQATNNDVPTPKRRAVFQKWINEQGHEVKNTQKATITKLLNSDLQDSNLVTALELSREITKTSLAKYPKIIKREYKGRIYENLAYHAAHTGRWGGRGVQLQNLPRPSYDINTVVNTVRRIDDYVLFSTLYSDVSKALSSGIRGALIPDINKKLLIGDYSQIEDRVIAWLAGEEKTLEAYRQKKDAYCITASSIYGYIVDKTMKIERSVGKVCKLALNYAGGIGAFATMAKNSGINLRPVYRGLWSMASKSEKDKAQWAYSQYMKRAKDPIDRESGMVADIIKQRYRFSNPKIVKFWQDLNAAAAQAILSKTPIKCGKLVWFMDGVFLYCTLPSGRKLAYPYPKAQETDKRTDDAQIVYEIQYFGKNAITQRWEMISTHGGTLAENITQAISRDIMAVAMHRLADKDWFQLLLTVHDELIGQVDTHKDYLNEFTEIMKQSIKWCFDLPIDVETHEGARYTK